MVNEERDSWKVLDKDKNRQMKMGRKQIRTERRMEDNRKCLTWVERDG